MTIVTARLTSDQLVAFAMSATNGLPRGFDPRGLVWMANHSWGGRKLVLRDAGEVSPAWGSLGEAREFLCPEGLQDSPGKATDESQWYWAGFDPARIIEAEWISASSGARLSAVRDGEAFLVTYDHEPRAPHWEPEQLYSSREESAYLHWLVGACRPEDIIEVFRPTDEAKQLLCLVEDDCDESRFRRLSSQDLARMGEN